MTAPTIRDALEADLDDLLVLDAGLFRAEAWSREAIRAEIDRDDQARCCLVAVMDATTVGYAAARLAGDTADLLRVGVRQAYRRCGVGSALVTEVVLRARAVGCERVLLEVSNANAAALSTYDHLGFAAIATRPRYYTDGQDAVVMARRLVPATSGALDDQRQG